MAKSIAEMITTLQAERDSIMDQLANDAATGLMPSDSFQGQSVDFVGFRRQLSERLSQINEQLNSLQPYEIRSVVK